MATRPARSRSLGALGFFTVISLAPGILRAQEPLTLEAAVQAALAGNASIRAAAESSAEADAHAIGARAGFFPRLSVTESWQRGNEPVFVFSSLLSSRTFTSANFAIDALNHPDPTGFLRTRVAAEQLVFDGGRQQSRSRSAALGRDIAAITRDEVAAGVAVEVVQAFGRVLAAQSAQRAATSSLTAAREDLARAERRRDAGLATDADVLSLKVHVADVQQRAIEGEGRVAIERAMLNRLAGAPVERAFLAVEPVLTGWGEPLDLPSLLAEADSARPELRRAEAMEQQALAAQGEARSAWLPRVAAQAAFDVSGTIFTDRASSWLVGAEVQWSFSTGGAELAGTRAAARAVARAGIEREDARRAVQVDVVRALRGFETARASFAAGLAAVDEARESERIIRDRFEAGVAGVTDVLRASTAVLDAEHRRVSALVESIVQRALLRRAVGRTP
jgi:outer membrane protein TolC